MYTDCMLKRFYEPLDAYVQPNVALLIYGPRRVGKTTLLNTYLAGTKLRYRLEHGDPYTRCSRNSALNRCWS